MNYRPALEALESRLSLDGSVMPQPPCDLAAPRAIPFMQLPTIVASNPETDAMVALEAMELPTQTQETFDPANGLGGSW